MRPSVWPWRQGVVASAVAAPAATPHEPEAAPEPQTAAWAQAHVNFWAARTRLTAADYADGLRHLNAVKHDVYVFDIDGADVNVREKHVHHPLAFNRRIEHFRVHLYRDHLREAAARAQLPRPVSVGVIVGDLARDVNPLLPVFTYQKRVGEPWLLLPDVEMLELRFYEEETPDSSTGPKLDRVVFSGSSTGKALDEEAVRNDASERLRYAARFVGDPQVEFSIGRASECVSPEAEAALKAKPYFRRVDWAEQLTRRYVLSLDGNGATCSRVVRTLRSRSCLVKQASDNLLFYFAGLLPWRHFIPVDDEEELARLAPMITRTDFPSEAICDDANAFCRDNLNRAAVVDYTAALMGGFSAQYLARL